MNNNLIKNLAVILSIVLGVIAIALYAYFSGAAGYKNVIAAISTPKTQVAVLVSEYVSAPPAYTPFSYFAPPPAANVCTGVINKSFAQIQVAGKASTIYFNGKCVSYYLYKILLSNAADKPADYKVTVSAVTNPKITLLVGSYSPDKQFVPSSALLAGTCDAKSSTEVYLIFTLSVPPQDNVIIAQDKALSIKIEIK